MEILLAFKMILCYYIFREKNYENQESVVFCSVLYINLHLLSAGDTRRQLNQIRMVLNYDK